MSGQSATLSIGKARAMAKGAGSDIGCGMSGTKASAPTEGKTLGDAKGKSQASGTISPKGKTKHNY